MSTIARKPLEYYLGLQYPVQFVAVPDGGYVALFPDLPGCLTQGETLQEVAVLAEESRALWIETEYERGSEIPLPSLPEEYSGKFNLRIPRSLHRSLATAAEREGVSLNQHVLTLLSRGDTQSRLERRRDGLEGDGASGGAANRGRASGATLPRSTPPGGAVASRSNLSSARSTASRAARRRRRMFSSRTPRRAMQMFPNLGRFAARLVIPRGAPITGRWQPAELRSHWNLWGAPADLRASVREEGLTADQLDALAQRA
jgi:predicted RNase H-like HicB family nuclease